MVLMLLLYQMWLRVSQLWHLIVLIKAVLGIGSRARVQVLHSFPSISICPRPYVLSLIQILSRSNFIYLILYIKYMYMYYSFFTFPYIALWHAWTLIDLQNLINSIQSSYYKNKEQRDTRKLLEVIGFYYLSCGDGFTGAHICPNSSSWPFFCI